MPRQPGVVSYETLRDIAINTSGGQIVTEINYPEAGGAMTVVELTPAQQGVLEAAFPQISVTPNYQIAPRSGAIPGVTGSSYAGWASCSLSSDDGHPSPQVRCSNTVGPELYVLGTGVQAYLTPPGTTSPNPGLAGAPISSYFGMIAQGLATLPSPASAAAFIDDWNHETAVTTAVLGRTTGGSVVGAYPTVGGLPQVKLHSVRIYPASTGGGGFPISSVAAAIDGIYQSITQHLLAWKDTAIGNEGAVLVFAHRSLGGYSAPLERALWDAWYRGNMVVVGSAGNSIKPDEPLDPSVLLSEPVLGSSPSRLPVAAPEFLPESAWARANNRYLILVAGLNATSGHYSQTNYGPGVDIYAPGQSLSLFNNLGQLTEGSVAPVSGTSFSAGYVAGLCLQHLSVHPWVSASVVRDRILAQGQNISAPWIGGTAMVKRAQLPTSFRTMMSTYAEWVSDCGAPGAPVTGDLDADGRSNGLEYASGGHARYGNALSVITYLTSPLRIRHLRSFLYDCGTPSLPLVIKESTTLDPGLWVPSALTFTPSAGTVVYQGRPRQSGAVLSDPRRYYKPCIE